MVDPTSHAKECSSHGTFVFGRRRTRDPGQEESQSSNGRDLLCAKICIPSSTPLEKEESVARKAKFSQYVIMTPLTFFDSVLQLEGREHGPIQQGK